jgi:hypothetical protein
MGQERISLIKDEFKACKSVGARHIWQYGECGDDGKFGCNATSVEEAESKL